MGHSDGQRPIVSFDCPEGPRDIITNGEDGFLIPIGDQEKMVNALELLSRSLEMRQTMGEMARKNSERFSEKTIVEKWCNLIKSQELKKGR